MEENRNARFIVKAFPSETIYRITERYKNLIATDGGNEPEKAFVFEFSDPPTNILYFLLSVISTENLMSSYHGQDQC